MVIDKEKFFRTKKHLRSIERKLDSKFSKESGKIRKRGRRRHCLISRITLGSKIQKRIPEKSTFFGFWSIVFTSVYI